MTLARKPVSIWAGVLGSASGGSHRVQWEKLPGLEFPPDAVRPGCPLSCCLPRCLLSAGAAWLLSPAVAVGEPPHKRICFCLKSVQFLVVFQPPVRGFETPSQATVRIPCRSWSVACIYKSYLFA